MAVRGDIHVEWYRSPRVVVVEAPSTELDLQDLVDTMAEIESERSSLDDPRIVESSGKQTLSDVVKVGITVVLWNAQLTFEEREYPSREGTATDDTQHDRLPGQILEDTAGDFSDVEPGDEVANLSDGSKATVIEAIDMSHLRHYTLQGGVSNEWTSGDTYKMQEVVLCSVSGGNLVLVDVVGDPIPAIVPSNGVSYLLQQATSASLLGVVVTEQDKDDIAVKVVEEDLTQHSQDNSLANILRLLKDIADGRWRIIDNTPFPQMVHYKGDNVTEVERFDLKDASGNAIDLTKVLIRDKVRV